MSDPVFRKTKLSMELDPQRAASTRSNRTALLVIISTVIWGVVAFSLINDTRIAIIATALIGLSALTTRIFDYG
jgi:hypothetical protein